MKGEYISIETARIMADIEKENKELQKRIDEAIELIKEAGCYDEELKTFCDDIWEELPDLLNILKG